MDVKKSVYGKDEVIKQVKILIPPALHRNVDEYYADVCVWRKSCELFLYHPQNISIYILVCIFFFHVNITLKRISSIFSE